MLLHRAPWSVVRRIQYVCAVGDERPGAGDGGLDILYARIYTFNKLNNSKTNMISHVQKTFRLSRFLPTRTDANG